MQELFFENQYMNFLVIFLGSVLAALIFNFILKKYIQRLAKKTKSDIDDNLIKATKKPIFALIASVGLYFSLKTLNLFETYSHLINKIYFVLIVFLVSFVVMRVISALIDYWFTVKRHFEKTPKLLGKIVGIIVYFIAAIIILKYLEIEISPLLATLGIGGLAIGLALQTTLSNFFSGLHIISDQPIRVGDFIKIGKDISGYVEDIGWRSTKIKTLSNLIIIIPNSKLAESVIVNRSLLQKEKSVVVQCGVSYESDLEKVEEITIDVATNIQKTVKGATRNFKPLIRFHTFADSNINFSIILKIDDFSDKYKITHEFIKALKKRYDEEKIDISWPVTKVYLKDNKNNS